VQHDLHRDQAGHRKAVLGQLLETFGLQEHPHHTLRTHHGCNLSHEKPDLGRGEQAVHAGHSDCRVVKDGAGAALFGGVQVDALEPQLHRERVEVAGDPQGVVQHLSRKDLVVAHLDPVQHGSDHDVGQFDHHLECHQLERHHQRARIALVELAELFGVTRTFSRTYQLLQNVLVRIRFIYFTPWEFRHFGILECSCLFGEGGLL